MRNIYNTPPPPPPSFLKYTDVCGVALPKAYFLVCFWQRVSTSSKLAADITSGIHAASENPQRISTATDGGGSMQQRRFCTAKTRHQQMYMDVHLLMRYLYPLFSKVSVPRYRKEGEGAAQKRVCAANSKFGTVHGRSFLDALAGIFCAILASALLISKNQTENLFSKARILFSAENIFTYINSG